MLENKAARFSGSASRCNNISGRRSSHVQLYDDTRHPHLDCSIQAANTTAKHQCDCFAFTAENEHKVSPIDVDACLLRVAAK